MNLEKISTKLEFLSDLSQLRVVQFLLEVVFMWFSYRWELVLLFKVHCSPYTCPTSFGSLSMPTYPLSPMSCSPSNTAWNQAAIPWSSHLGCYLYRDSTRNAMLANVQVINWPTWQALKDGTKISSRKSPLPHETIGTTYAVIHKENEWQTHPQHPPPTKLQVTLGLNCCTWNVGICSYTSYIVDQKNWLCITPRWQDLSLWDAISSAIIHPHPSNKLTSPWWTTLWSCWNGEEIIAGFPWALRATPVTKVLDFAGATGST